MIRKKPTYGIYDARESPFIAADMVQLLRIVGQGYATKKCD
jgi:hypothetical protein